MQHDHRIAGELKLRPEQVGATIQLLDSGNTIPFIARYRKEVTGRLDEEQLRQVAERLQRLRALDERRATIVATVEKQGNLTPALHQRLLTADTLIALEDLYQPHKPKRRTRASIAREKGLEPLAILILKQAPSGKTAAQVAAAFCTEQAPTADDALAGARDIVAEMISDHAEVRQRLREKALQWATICCQRMKDAQDERGTYSLYYDYEGQVSRLRAHQILAINRGEAEKVLRVSIEIPEKDWLLAIRTYFRPDPASPLATELQAAMEDAARRLLIPAIERDVRRTLTEQAESHAIAVFARNLRGLLSQPPLSGQTVLAIDPGFRTGCKVAVISPTGKVLDIATVYPHPPQNRQSEARTTLAGLVERHRVTLVAIGNGTASRETEQLVAELTRKLEDVHYLMVNEAGASVYSASKLARGELPEMDVSLRGAVSIGRRAQDPLAELVKIDPKSIGVGLYQHDVNQKELAASLDSVVESVVNQVGVEVNSASPALLTHVAGIGPTLAERVVQYRDEYGPFTSRKALLNVSGLGSKVFEQAAGFLRIQAGENPLDASAIHPESYGVATALLTKAGLSPNTPPAERVKPLQTLRTNLSLDSLAAELKTGVPTLEDIIEQLLRPGRDPREELPPPILRSDVLSMDDLRPGLLLNGTVRNVVDFGAFVDIGVKQDGLLHRSQIPEDVVLNVGEVIEVVVGQVEAERGRISLGWPE
jgi:uncharacterized protein